MANNNAPEILQVRKETLDFSTPLVPAELAPILSFSFLPIFAVRRNHVNTLLG